jgi:hypothetical protein
MSVRRGSGEVVRKKAYAGFLEEPCLIVLHTEDPPEWQEYCMLDCGDPECREWANCEVVVDGKPTGKFCYHVSECEMEDF